MRRRHCIASPRPGARFGSIHSSPRRHRTVARWRSRLSVVEQSCTLVKSDSDVWADRCRRRRTDAVHGDPERHRGVRRGPVGRLHGVARAYSSASDLSRLECACEGSRARGAQCSQRDRVECPGAGASVCVRSPASMPVSSSRALRLRALERRKSRGDFDHQGPCGCARTRASRCPQSDRVRCPGAGAAACASFAAPQLVSSSRALRLRTPRASEGTR